MSAVAIALMAEVKPNDPAPAFSAKDQNGQDWSLQEHLADKYLVIYFYPAAMTGGCTKQACSYRDYVKTSSGRNLEIVGISGDTPENLRIFRQAEGLNFTLLSDPDGAVAKAFGVPVRTGEKTITRTVGGKDVELSRSATSARWTFIIDPQGMVVYRDTAVKAVQDLQRVLSFLQQQKK